MRRDQIGKLLENFAISFMLLTALALAGCEGDKGDQGAAGVSTGTLTGTVTNSLTSTPVAGATVTLSPTVEGTPPIATNSSGVFSATLPLTAYTATVSASGYTSQTFSAGVFAGQTTTRNVALVPLANASVGVAPVSGAAAGSSVTLTAVPAIFDTATPNPTFSWTQTSGPAATISGGTTATPTVTLPGRSALKAQLATVEAPRQSVDPNTDAPLFSRLNRNQVLGITSQALISGLQLGFQVTMTSGPDVVTTPVTVTVKPMFVPQASTRNVPIGQPVLLQGKSFTNNVFSSAVAPVLQTTWNWTLAPPAGSGAVLNDPATINPDFTPDVPGIYTATESVAGQTLTIYAGSWQGAVTGLDANGDPTANPNQTGTNPPVVGGTAGITGCPCHYAAGDTQTGKFTSAWNLSGHSHIISGLTAHLPGGPTIQNITDPNGHWTPTACGPCHTVGFAQYSSAIKANGFSEVYRAEGLAIVKGANAWVNTVTNFPRSASLMQIQCENCHGPSASPGHTTSAIPGNPAASPAPAAGNDFFARVSWSADVCGTCHGEPTRHGKWQQWRSSGHGDFETAMYEGITGASAVSLGSVNPSCGGCHTGQAFGRFNSQLKGGNASRTLSATILADPVITAVNLDTVQPQVCVTCHGPHNPGTRSGLTGSIVGLGGYDPTYGTTFVGSTPLLPAGFQANGVGKGALCIVCHESRNGEPVAGAGNPTLHEDGDPNFDPNFAKVTSYAGAHDAAQGDVLMGRNAYFVTGVRSPHSLIADTCVTCHMELMPAPNDLDPARLGTNHQFAVDLSVANICSNCHGFTGGQIQTAFDGQYSAMVTAIANKIYFIKTASLTATGHFPAQDGATVTFTPDRAPTISVTGSPTAAANAASGTALATYLAGVTYKGITYDQPTSGPTSPTFANLPAGHYYNGIIPAIYKANWNATLVKNDDSRGIHNPSFGNDIMQQTVFRVGVF